MENLSKDKSVSPREHQAVVIGVSAGGIDALRELLALIPVDFNLAVVIVQHLHPQQDRFFIEYLGECCAIPVQEAEEKESVSPGVVYFAPANYHLLIESDRTFSLSVDEKVNFSRPSIDVMFETAAETYGSKLIGIVLTGASKDGAAGLRRIKEGGGMTIVQDPATAEFPIMPAAAMGETEVDYVMDLTQIGRFLAAMGRPLAAAVESAPVGPSKRL
jgi:two-component system, chemotaxis family, protein-glutamate methylesterase/glutaminase